MNERFTELTETLEPYADDPTVVRELHDVPPYRVYEVRLEGRRAALKVDAHPRGRAADEGRVHEYVARRTSAAVPEPVAVGSDHYLTAWNEAIARTRSAETLEPTWTRAAGRWIGTLHDDTAGAFDGFGRPRDDGESGLALESHEDWTDAVLDRLGSHRSVLERVGYADVADAVAEFLRANPRAFEGAGEPVLCHGDAHPEHVVAGAGPADAAAAIDFEHALVAPAEYDYWRFAIPYVAGRDDVDETVSRAFREGYESVRSLPADLERRAPIYRAVLTVAFLESLFLQRNVAPARRTEVADRLRGIVCETLADRRDGAGDY